MFASHFMLKFLDNKIFHVKVLIYVVLDLDIIFKLYDKRWVLDNDDYNLFDCCITKCETNIHIATSKTSA